MFADHIFYRDLTIGFPTIERGEGVFLYDTKGNRYLDACSGSAAANIGYGRREVIEAIIEQAQKITYLHGYSFKSQASSCPQSQEHQVHEPAGRPSGCTPGAA